MTQFSGIGIVSPEFRITHSVRNRRLKLNAAISPTRSPSDPELHPQKIILRFHHQPSFCLKLKNFSEFPQELPGGNAGQRRGALRSDDRLAHGVAENFFSLLASLVYCS